MKSIECPYCGSTHPWINLDDLFQEYPHIEFQESHIRLKRLGDKPYIPLSPEDYRWMCLKCFGVWIDSEFKLKDGEK